MRYFGEVLETARRARGLTQAQLAELAGVTQAAIHRYEKESRAPSIETVERIAEALGLTVGFFEHAGRVEGAMAVDAHMRRRQTAKPTAWRRTEARLNELRIHASLLYEEISLSTTLRMPTFDPLEVTPQDAARLVRMQWRLPAGPVRQLTQWVESAGCLVVEEDFGTPRIDGLSQWVADHPVILLNERAPTDRKRLTIAHELGHLVLHSEDVTPYVELEANQFAAEFLMPNETIKPKLRNLTLGKLMDLKREWGVSIQALIERGYSLDAISATQRMSLYKALSSRGWRTREPVSDELTPEVPALASDIASAISTRGFNEEEIARLAGWTRASGNNVFVPSSRRLKLVP